FVGESEEGSDEIIEKDETTSKAVSGDKDEQADQKEPISEEMGKIDENEETHEDTGKETNTLSEVEKEATGEIAIASVKQAEQILENIIDDFKLLRKDGTEFKEGELIEINEDLRFELNWSLPNDHDYKNGATFEFQLPKQLTVHNKIVDRDLGGYGSFNVDLDGKVTFTFNEKIEHESNVKGEFWFDTELKEVEIKSTTEVLEIIFNEDV